MVESRAKRFFWGTLIGNRKSSIGKNLKDGVFSGPAMFNLTECIYYEGITLALADDSTSSFLSQNCMNNGALRMKSYANVYDFKWIFCFWSLNWESRNPYSSPTRML